jgi:hypothetical protein
VTAPTPAEVAALLVLAETAPHAFSPVVQHARAARLAEGVIALAAALAAAQAENARLRATLEEKLVDRDNLFNRLARVEADLISDSLADEIAVMSRQERLAGCVVFKDAVAARLRAAAQPQRDGGGA